MTEQLSFLAPDTQPVVKGAERWAECRARITQGCGGHHARGPVVAGFPLVQWHCCDACPVRAEVASASC